MTRDDTESREKIGENVTIIKRGKKGTYVAEFQFRGHHKRASLKTTNKKIARQRALKIEFDLISGVVNSQPKAVAIKDAVEQYLTYLETEGRARRTVTRYRSELNSLAAFMVAKKVTNLSQISPGHVDAYRAERKKAICEGTMYHEGVVAKQFLKWCVSRGLIKQSPLADYKITKPRRTKRPAPTVAQVNAILELCSPSVRPRVAVLALTGMRVGELQALRKTDVDLRTGFINVSRQIAGPTKTRTTRVIPIHPHIKPILKAQLRADSHELFFTAQASSKYPSGGHSINTKRLNEDFKSAATRAKLKGFTLHSLRHFFNTLCVTSGVPEQIVKAWMGHVDPSMTGHYFHLTEADSKKFMEQVEFGDSSSRPAADHAA